MVKGSPGMGRGAEMMGRAGSEAAAGGKVCQCKTLTNPALCSGSLIFSLTFSGQERNGNWVLHIPFKGSAQEPRIKNSLEEFSSEHALKG